MIDLYPHQTKLKTDTRDAFTRVRSVLMQAVTGFGKTNTAVSIIRDALAKGKIVWFVAPRRELLRQTANCMGDWGIPHAFIASGKPTGPPGHVQVVSLQTVVRRFDKVTPPDLCIIDEIHVGGGTLDSLVDWLKSKGSYILGLSATPCRLDGQGLGKYCDEMVCGPSLRWMIENKYLAKYKAYAPSHLDLSGIRTVAGDYSKKQLAEKMENERALVGDVVDHYKKHALGKLGVTFGVSIKHSQMMAERYREAGVPASHIDGKTPEDERRRIARAFAKGELLQLTCAELLCFGYDLASASGIKGRNIQCISDCQPTKSEPKIMQKWGRGLRYDEDIHLFFDHANNFNTHGMPCDDREWTLESVAKKNQQRAEPIRECPKCYRAHNPAPSCPECGYVYPIEQRSIKEIEGELKEIEILRAKEEKARKKEKRASKIAKNKALPPEKKKAAREAMRKNLLAQGRPKRQVFSILKSQGLL